MRSTILHLYAFALALTTLPCMAGVENMGAGKNNVPTLPPPPVDDADGWWFRTVSYSWATAISGDVGLGPVSASADMSIKDVFDELDFGYMTYFEAGKGRWSVSLDGIYAKLSDDNTFGHGIVSGKASMEEEEAYVTARLNYALVKNEAVTMKVFAGSRWTYFDLDLNINTDFGSRRFDQSADFFDPIIGANAEIQLGGKWMLFVGGDIGGFGTESDLTWQANLDFAYALTPRIRLAAGFRALGVDYDKDGFKLDTIMYGPTVGWTFKF